MTKYQGCEVTCCGYLRAWGDTRNKVDADITSFLVDTITGFMKYNTLITISYRIRLEQRVISHLVRQCIIYYIVCVCT